MTEAWLTIQGVTKRFDRAPPVLGPIDLAIARESFVALLGPSGCGKSTLLRLIAGLMPVSAGAIAWQDRQPPTMGFVFQEPTLMPWARVFDNAALAPALKGSIDRAKVEGALDRVGLGKVADHYPRQLSGGMRMRVSIARALAADPGLMLMDEPFAALDEITRSGLNDDLLTAFAASGMGILFVTHSVFESVYLAQRIIVLSKGPGRVIADLPVGAPYPRGEDWRLSADYAALAREVSKALRSGMAP